MGSPVCQIAGQVCLFHPETNESDLTRAQELRRPQRRTGNKLYFLSRAMRVGPPTMRHPALQIWHAIGTQDDAMAGIGNSWR